MAGGLTSQQTDNLMDKIFRGSGVRQLDYIEGTLKLALCTSLPSASSPGTQVTGGSYARQSLTTSNLSSPSGGQIYNTGTIEFEDLPSCTVVALEVYDDNGVRLLWEDLDEPIKVESGQAIAFNPGAVTFTLSSV